MVVVLPSDTDMLAGALRFENIKRTGMLSFFAAVLTLLRYLQGLSFRFRCVKISNKYPP